MRANIHTNRKVSADNKSHLVAYTMGLFVFVHLLFLSVWFLFFIVLLRKKRLETTILAKSYFVKSVDETSRSDCLIEWAMFVERIWCNVWRLYRCSMCMESRCQPEILLKASNLFGFIKKIQCDCECGRTSLDCCINAKVIRNLRFLKMITFFVPYSISWMKKALEWESFN